MKILYFFTHVQCSISNNRCNSVRKSKKKLTVGAHYTCMIGLRTILQSQDQFLKLKERLVHNFLQANSQKYVQSQHLFFLHNVHKIYTIYTITYLNLNKCFIKKLSQACRTTNSVEPFAFSRWWAGFILRTFFISLQLFITKEVKIIHQIWSAI